jgi:DNA replication protein DnaC
MDMMKAARGDGTAPRLIERLGKVQLLILDDFAMYPLASDQRRDMMEIVEERAQRRSTIITSQLGVEDWHRAFGDPTLADALLDRFVNSAYRIELDGESMRGNQRPPELSP